MAKHVAERAMLVNNLGDATVLRVLAQHVLGERAYSPADVWALALEIWRG